MKVRPLKRSVIVKNILLFQAASLAYLQIVKSLHLGNSAFKWSLFANLIQDKPWVVASFLAAFGSVYFITRFSSFFFSLFCLIVLGESAFHLLKSFDKLILILTFCYAISSMYFLLFWELEKQEAVYRPSFDKNSIGKIDDYSISIRITSLQDPLEGALTNWDLHSCFFLVESPKTLKGRISFSVFFEGLQFQCHGQIVTKYANGYGVQIKETAGPLNWKSFYDIINDRGYKPRYA